MSRYEPKPDPRIEAVSRGTGKVVLVVSATGALAFLLLAALIHVTPPPAKPLVVFATWFIGFAVVVLAVLRRVRRLPTFRNVIERNAVRWAVTLTVSLLASLAILSALHELRLTSDLLVMFPLSVLGSFIGWSVAQWLWPSETARLDQLQGMNRSRGWWAAARPTS